MTYSGGNRATGWPQLASTLVPVPRKHQKRPIAARMLDGLSSCSSPHSHLTTARTTDTASEKVYNRIDPWFETEVSRLACAAQIHGRVLDEGRSSELIVHKSAT
jgi:hypothetical protein